MDFKTIQDDHFHKNLLRFWPFVKYGSRIFFFRYLTINKHFSPYFKNKHMNCARQNQINERIIKPNSNPRGTVMYTIWRRVIDKRH